MPLALARIVCPTHFKETCIPPTLAQTGRLLGNTLFIIGSQILHELAGFAGINSIRAAVVGAGAMNWTVLSCRGLFPARYWLSLVSGCWLDDSGPIAFAGLNYCVRITGDADAEGVKG